ncbi:hypothetical protein LIER_31873 [Lithospermum erythrorhizon]|uniref:DUF4283 domain-containing protein n=1 Tax=Lithospermum erythrorhizon TaxID=34254 RepID=A0AAV3RUN3_LITER
MEGFFKNRCGQAAYLDLMRVPLFADRTTSEQSRLAFARVCVEIDVNNELFEELPVKYASGQQFSRRVQYEWVPSKCSKCKKFGHSDASCKATLFFRPRVKKIYTGESSKGESSDKSIIVKDSEAVVVQNGQQEVFDGGSQESLFIRDMKVPTLDKPEDSSVSLNASPKLQGWGFVHNITNPVVGRIIVAWDMNYCDVQVVNLMDQLMLVEVQLADGTVFLFSAVYGANLYLRRRDLWQSLGSVVLIGKPWIIAGDFNVIKDITLTSGDSHPPNIAMLEFNTCLEVMDVTKLSSHGCLYTRSPNWQSRNSCLRKLDYGFCDEYWLRVFGQSSAHFLQPGVVIHWKQDIVNGPKLFKYQAFWQEHSSYEMVVQDAWGTEVGSWSALEVVLRRLKLVKQELNKFNKLHFQRSVLGYRNVVRI